MCRSVLRALSPCTALLVALIVSLVSAQTVSKDPLVIETPDGSRLISVYSDSLFLSFNLPLSWEITCNQGPEFRVYYFSESDSSGKSRHGFGMYLGDFPSYFFSAPDADISHHPRRHSNFLGEDVSWHLHDSEGRFRFEGIRPAEDLMLWRYPLTIHLFGRSQTIEGRDSLMTAMSRAQVVTRFGKPIHLALPTELRWARLLSILGIVTLFAGITVFLSGSRLQRTVSVDFPGRFRRFRFIRSRTMLALLLATATVALLILATSLRLIYERV